MDEHRIQPRRPIVVAKLRPPATDALSRQRVLASIEATLSYRLVLLVAPAGAGKTTELAQFARTTGRTCAWLRVETGEGDAGALLRYVERALTDAVEGLRGGWRSLADAAQALAAVRSPSPTVLVLDDLHDIHGSPAEQTLEQLVGYLPDWLRILAASRHAPAFNVPQLQVSGQLGELPGDVLRWRAWEVERLFREFYREPLRPEEAARLTQRTEGWAAGLQLFHLAREQLPLGHRDDLIDDLHTRPGLVRDYLTRNVLARLREDLRTFLIDTCVLGRLDPDLCDRIRDRTDSAGYLAELVSRRLFTSSYPDGRGYRYHEVLRAYLDVSLLERDGPAAARARYARAGRVLEDDGAIAEAVRAYARGEAWDDVARLLGHDGPVLASGRGAQVLADLPANLVSNDPWLRLMEARARVGDGRLESALEAYRRAENAFGQGPGADICRRERQALQNWVDVREHPTVGVTDLLRQAVRRDPLGVVDDAAATDTASGQVVAALATLLAGAPDDARRRAREVGARPDAEVFTLAAARTVEHLADLLAGTTRETRELISAAETFEQLGAPWVARMLRSLTVHLLGRPRAESDALRQVLDGRGDPWGAAVLTLLCGITGTGPSPTVDDLDEAAERFRRLGAGTLEAWARSWAAVAAAQGHRPDAYDAAVQARGCARATAVPGAEVVAELAVARCGPRPAAEEARLRAFLQARELGLDVAGMGLVATPRTGRSTPGSTPPIEASAAVRAPTRLTCFGGLDLVLAGASIDLDEMRPQARKAFAQLAIAARSPVRRSVLTEALWPDEDDAVGARRLQVLVSTVRRHLEPDVAAGARTLLMRTGDSYELRLPEDAFVDVLAFDEALAAAHRASLHDDPDGFADHLRRAYELYGGELLAGLGSDEWILAERDRYRGRFTRVTRGLAGWLLTDHHDPGACIEVCLAGLRADRYASTLWSLLARGHRAAGDERSARAAEAEHAEVLAELDLDGVMSGRGTRSP